MIKTKITYLDKTIVQEDRRELPCILRHIEDPNVIVLFTGQQRGIALSHPSENQLGELTSWIHYQSPLWESLPADVKVEISNLI